MQRANWFRLVLLGVLMSFGTLVQADVPTILLAKVYQDGLDVNQYLVSEKLDGVRAIWDGKKLVSRQGNVFNAPVWFTQRFPRVALDGELWIARGAFEQVSGTVRKQTPEHSAWQLVKYYVFELPDAKGDFASRYQDIEQLVAASKSPYLKAVKQQHVQSKHALQQWLKQVVAAKGEGLMLHRADAEYVTGRNDALLKLKPYLDAEAKVIDHIAGKGRLTGKMGALLVETPEGLQFKLGTGFSDVERTNPPAIGSTVTYSYKDKTTKGKPKFASFLRVRID
jgi:DNA ligase 1